MNALGTKTLTLALLCLWSVAAVPRPTDFYEFQRATSPALILDLGFEIGMASAFLAAHKRNLAEKHISAAGLAARRAELAFGGLDAIQSLIRQKDWDEAYAQLQTARRRYRAELAVPEVTRLSDKERTAVEEAVRQVYVEMGQKVSQRDPDAWLKYFLESDEFTFVENGGISRSYATFADTVGARWARFTEMKVAWGELLVDVLAPTVAVVTASVDLSGTGRMGEVHALAGTWTSVSALRDGEWKVASVTVTFQPSDSS